MARPVTVRLNGTQIEKHDEREQHEGGRNAGERREPGRGAVVEDMDRRSEIAERVCQGPVQVVVDLAAGLRPRNSATPIKIAPVASVAIIGWIRP